MVEAVEHTAATAAVAPLTPPKGNRLSRFWRLATSRRGEGSKVRDFRLTSHRWDRVLIQVRLSLTPPTRALPVFMPNCFVDTTCAFCRWFAPSSTPSKNGIREKLPEQGSAQAHKFVLQKAHMLLYFRLVPKMRL